MLALSNNKGDTKSKTVRHENITRCETQNQGY